MVSGICALPKSGCDQNTNVSTITYRSVDLSILDSCEVRSLFRDTENAMWIGTRRNGIFKKSGDQLYKVGNDLGAIAFAQDAAGDVWFSARGLWRLSGDKLRSYSEEETESRVMFAIVPTDDGQVLVSGSSGVTLLKNGEVVDWIGTAQGLPHPVVHDAYRSPDGVMWLATRKAGLNKYQNGKWETFLADINCRKIFITSDNRMLVGTSDGLLEFERNASASKWIKQEGFALLPMLEVNGTIYCVGEEQGLWSLRKNKLKKVKLTRNPIVFSVALNEDGRLVIGTANGLIIR